MMPLALWLAFIASFFVRTNAERMGAWSMNSKYGNPFKDTSENNMDGTPFNLQMFEKFPSTNYKTTRFSGADDSYVEIDNSVANISPKVFGLVAYVKPDTGTFEREGPILSFLDENDDTVAVVQQQAGGLLQVFVFNKFGEELAFISTPLNTGKWSRIALSGAPLNETMFLYVDGVARGPFLYNPEAKANSDVISPATKIQIGRASKYLTEGKDEPVKVVSTFRGHITCVFLFNHVIAKYTEEGVKSLHDSCMVPPATCSAHGDPHFEQFDGNTLEYQGSCQYTLVRDGCHKGLPSSDSTFEVIIDTWRKDEKVHASYVKSVLVKLNGTEILLGQENVVSVNGVGVLALPVKLHGGDVWAKKLGKKVWVKTNKGIEVSWNGNKNVKVTVDFHYINKTCGICGVFNNDPTDDLIAGPSSQCLANGTATIAGNLADSTEDFVETWLYAIDEDDPFCVEACGDKIVPPSCPVNTVDKAKDYCMPLKEEDGRFAECIEQIVAAGDSYHMEFYLACYYDYCLTNETAGLICEHAEMLAAKCYSKYGISQGTWRDASFCPMACPVGSVYSSCVKMCDQASCLDSPDVVCSVDDLVECEEGCECTEGYVLEDGECIEEENCGCPYNGQILPVGTMVVGNNCTSYCACLSPGAEALNCSDYACPDSSICGVVDGVVACTCEEGHTWHDGACRAPLVCRLTGDPHVYQFDGPSLKSMGSCSYVAARDNCAEGIPVEGKAPNYEVIVKNWKRGKETKVTWVKEVSLKADKHTITLGQGGSVTVDDKLIDTLPYTVSDNLYVHERPNYIYIETLYGVQVMWDRVQSVRVTVDVEYMGEMCGLCGNYNGDDTDDMVVGPNDNLCPMNLPTDLNLGDLIDDPAKWTTTWLYEVGTDADCILTCTNQTLIPDCTEADKVEAEAACSPLIDPKGALKECINNLPEGTTAPFLESCVFDLCTEDDDTNLLCSHASELANDCEVLYNMSVNWRSAEFCPCPATCEYPDGTQDPACDEEASNNCAGGCECDEGFTVHNGACLPESFCTCKHEESGTELLPGRTEMLENCTALCTCTGPGRAPECTENPCTGGQECVVLDGVRQCACPDGTLFVEGKCIGPKTCHCSGDPHCHSFDDRKHTFHGKCKYTLARDACLTGVPNGEPNFEVVINNRRSRPGKSAAQVDEVTVLFPKQNIEILLQQEGVVSLKTEIITLPKDITPEIRVYDQPNYVYVEATSLGLTVQWDRIYSVRVTVDPKMAFKTCGLCGIMDGDPADDLVIGPSSVCLPKEAKVQSGDMTEDEALFGNSWLHALDDADEGCSDDCDLPPEVPTECECEAMGAADICAPIKDKEGPLAACLEFLSEESIEEYYSSCVFDTCIMNATDTKFVCIQASNLVATCLADHEIDDIAWRSYDFCPPGCPENAEYRSCGSTCVPTCQDINGKECEKMSAATLNACKEGCFCKEGFISRGSDCVPASDCTEPKYPCNNQVNPETNEAYNASIRCWTCNNEKSMAACYDAGAMKTCPGNDQAICQRDTRYDKNGDPSKVDMFCTIKSACPEGSLGKVVEDDVGDQTICHYGDVVPNKISEPVFECNAENYVAACELHSDVGSGNDSVTRYYFNGNKCQCQEFTFTGVGGNANNFASIAQCEAACATFSPPADCLEEEAAPGPCPDFEEKFYFSVEENKCKKFQYGGCEGSANRFDTKIDCRMACKGLSINIK
ncbi:hypothetical protein CAPTEDRAFT_227119 [Capitella teleta]|uniref:Uncharacterized protein n=1 Tax=Capitella teleta TaxID=283909 RepID=R7TVR6_CAPTE|nr:hypothetical protein CAPTEDRAFT_227119 [Capitella teleta]|eukprot:ELT97988.1 hypothetical protein CAPTEDRAFT_227119 [Capitella teleta]